MRSIPSIGVVVFVGACIGQSLLAQNASRTTIFSILSDDQKSTFGLRKLDEREFTSLDKWVTDLLVRAIKETLDPESLEGASIIGEDGEMLGKITRSSFDSKSIGNDFGEYGSRFRSKSHFSAFSKYASSTSNESAFNTTATKPPLIFLRGSVVGRLSVNKSISPRADPYAVIGYVKYSSY